MDDFEKFMSENKDRIYKYTPKWEDLSLQEKLDYLDITEDQLFENARNKTKRDKLGRIIIND